MGFKIENNILIKYIEEPGVTDVVIPDSVTSIGRCTFNGCKLLTNVIIGNGVTSIGDYAFAGCTSLTDITIPDGVTSIGERAFYGCTSLESITIPDSVTSIGEYAFYGCTSLDSVIIPDGVTSIGSCTFKDCTSLTTINVDSNNKYYSSANGVLFDKNKTELTQYPIGKTSTSYSIPNSVTNIGDEAFECCTSLVSITIPDSVTSIGWYALYHCTSLTSVTINSNNIDNIKKLNIPKSAVIKCNPDSITDKTAKKEGYITQPIMTPLQKALLDTQDIIKNNKFYISLER